MDFKSIITGDLERELGVTRRVLAAVPGEKFDYRPHEKSMTLSKLAIHVATLPLWMTHALALDVLDFSRAPRPPQSVADTAALLAIFDKSAQELRAAAAAFDPAKWEDTWKMTDGARVFTEQPRSKVFRVFSFNHMIHHRGQLCVYLRLLNVRVPVVYFNTADDPNFTFE